MSDFLRQFAQSFARLDKHNLHLLDSLYSQDISFTDPLHQVHGISALQAYFAELYSNVEQLRFDFHAFDHVADGEGYLRWTMSFATRAWRVADRFRSRAAPICYGTTRFTGTAITLMLARCFTNTYRSLAGWSVG